MAYRRVLLLLIVAAFLLVAPGRALATPQWLPAEPQDAAGSGAAADVAADADGNAVAVWLSAGEVRASYRPRGGPWGPPENLDPGAAINTTQPRVTVQPNGQFVAVWVVDGAGSSLRWARRPAGGGWSGPATVTAISNPPAVAALEASADGSVTVMTLDEGSGSTNTKPAGSETWGPDENVPLPQNPHLAVAPDGSAVAAATGSCSGEVPCVVAAYRPPGGPWGAAEEAGTPTGSSSITGLEVAATPGSAYTVVWGEGTFGEGNIVPPGRVRSNDRASGSAGAWGSPQTVADLPADAPGCFTGNCFDLAAGPGGEQVAVWQQNGTAGNRMSAALRTPGGPWGGVENVGDAGSGTAEPHAAVTSNGIPVVAWGSAARIAAVGHGSHRTAGGWQTVEIGTPAETTVRLGDLAVDADGNALTAWDEAPGGVFSAGFDGGGPRFTAFSLPRGSLVEAPFSAAADDNWSPPASIAWAFGDGPGATGASVTHAYRATGAFSATASAVDAVGNSAAVSGTVTVTAQPTPAPDPCGTGDKDKDGINDTCDTSDGSSRPIAFKTVNAKVVSGEIFVKRPAGAARASQAKAPKGFVRLEGAQTIPVRSILDTSKGRARLRTASDTRKHVQTADFFRGRFLIRQVRKPRGKARKRSTKLITELRLTGSSFSKACKARKASISAKRRSKKRVRRLFGDGKGSFRTRGRNAAATVRGTRWSVQDRCDGTLVTVQRGRVEVRDLVKRKIVIVRSGRTYLARRR
jgi:PKD domain